MTVLKAWLSTQVDSGIRQAYARFPGTHPRRWVAVGTANEEVFALPYDPSGERRLFPVDTTTRNGLTPHQTAVRLRKALDEYREQLWAEALHRAKKGEGTMPDADVAVEQGHNVDRFRYRSPLELYLESALESGSVVIDGRTLAQISASLQDAGREDAGSAAVQKALRALGYSSKRVRHGGRDGRLAREWHHSDCVDSKHGLPQRHRCREQPDRDPEQQTFEPPDEASGVPP